MRQMRHSSVSTLVCLEISQDITVSFLKQIFFRFAYYYYKNTILFSFYRFYHRVIYPLLSCCQKRKLFVLSVPDEGYSINASCQLNQIYTFLLSCRINSGTYKVLSLIHLFICIKFKIFNCIYDCAKFCALSIGGLKSSYLCKTSLFVD